MRQDRRLNGWVLLGSVIQVILSIVLLAAGIGVSVAGFLYKKQLAKIDDLQFFLAQDGITKLQLKFLKNQLLKPEILYLALGIIVGVVGLISLILAIVSMSHAKKRRVVRHRAGLFFISLISLALVGCVATYLVMEFKTITDNIKYVGYGLGGAFAFVGLCSLLGIIFGRSEKFMSNDNGKYKFGKAKAVKEARANANHNAMNAQVQNQAPQQNVRVAPNGQPQRPAQMQPQRPMPPRPPMQSAGRPNQPMNPNMQRPVPPRPTGAPSRPMPPRPNQVGTQQARPAGAYCPKCGKQLSPDEHICTLCGYKVRN